ncbi:MAG: hypothetical protein JOZ72_03525 [Alphaproteobacteria bacterium]|nr:hypothetical protein [Alphaproteobacteria bacterium]
MPRGLLAPRQLTNDFSRRAPTSNRYFSSYDWDPNGNLIDRSDTWQGYTEKFCYMAQLARSGAAPGSDEFQAGLDVRMRNF